MENTIGYVTREELNRDHLHIRGEYWNDQVIATNDRGSPPHTWRIPLNSTECTCSGGITSTYVENTMPHSTAILIAEDHLHIRGEYSVSRKATDQDQGSPPHTWRILGVVVLGAGLIGITSTYVENTQYQIDHHYLHWDHLHIRGEYN